MDSEIVSRAEIMAERSVGGMMRAVLSVGGAIKAVASIGGE